MMCPLVVAAEFIIHLAENNKTFEDFKKVLIENGAEFSVCIRNYIDNKLFFFFPNLLYTDMRYFSTGFLHL